MTAVVLIVGTVVSGALAGQIAADVLNLRDAIREERARPTTRT